MGEERKWYIVCWKHGGVNKVWLTEDEAYEMDSYPNVSSVREM